MTGAELDRHRIGELEKDLTDQAIVVRSLEREVDRLKIELAGAVGVVAKLEGRLEATGEALTAKLTKAREAELLEEGAKSATRRLWKAWLSITMAAVGVGGMITAIIALFLH
jgi:predicted RNase H-like nuclease (RuvC/YqgF family)